MAAVIDLRILGAPELIRRFAKYEPNVQRKVARQAFRKAGKSVQQKAKALAPVGDRTEGVHHKQLIKVRAAKRSRRRIGVSIGYFEKGTGDDRGTAHKVELGTQHKSPQPHLRPALKENRDLILREIRIAIQAGLLKLA